MLNDGTSFWDGATAKVTVSGNAVTGVDIISGGSAYTDGETLDFDSTVLGGSGGEITIATAGISSVIGNTVQITGIGTLQLAITLELFLFPQQIKLPLLSPTWMSNQFLGNT